MERVEVLELAKSLFIKEELTEDEILEWNSINRTEDLTDALTERMDNDHALTVAVLDYLTKSGTNLDQIIFSAVAIGNYSFHYICIQQMLKKVSISYTAFLRIIVIVSINPCLYQH